MGKQKELDIIFDTMVNDFINFDPVEFKYKVLLEAWESYNSEGKYKFFSKLREYESAKQFSELTRKEYRHLQANLDMVYADSGQTDSVLRIFEAVCDKVINRYINIDGIERLFSEKYADFEWEMHLGINHKSYSMEFYRDHFIHQVKDAYCMMKLLEEGGFYDDVKMVLENEGSGKIARFVQKYLKQQIYKSQSKPIMTCLEERDKLQNVNFVGLENSRIIREHYLYNIIYMSCLLAGLFHDIGYPATASMSENRKLIDYVVESYHFEQGKYDFDRIMALLQNSLLFRVVAPEEIRKRIEGDKPDHGVLSALLFLLHFYENGAIHHLEPYKVCAIELAGLAIYNHTNVYKISTPKKEADYYRCVFSLNPISYLLRICDDLQEWGRIYFEITRASNLIFCRKCHMLVLRRQQSADKMYYRCNCSKDAALFEPIFDYSQFPYRRIYNITVCQKLIVKYEEGSKRYRFVLDYELSRLLHIAYIDAKYAKYRIDELNKLKKLFLCQEIFEKVYLDYFVTPNILLIKAAIVGEYMELSQGYTKNFNEILAQIYDERNNDGLWNEKKMDDSIETCVKEYYETIIDESAEGEINKYLKKAFGLYVRIYIWMKLGRKINQDPKHGLNMEAKLKEWLEREISKDERFYSKNVKILLEDCAVQASRMRDNIDKYMFYPDDYFEIFTPKCSENVFYNACTGFANADKYEYFVDRQEEDPPLDAFTDLFCIKEIIDKITASHKV